MGGNWTPPHVQVRYRPDGQEVWVERRGMAIPPGFGNMLAEKNKRERELAEQKREREQRIAEWNQRIDELEAGRTEPWPKG